MIFTSTWFWILILVNIFVVLLYVVWNLVRKKEKGFSIAMKAGLMFALPLAGSLFIFLGYVCYRIFFFQSVDLEDVIFSKDRVEEIHYTDEERDKNIVSLEEALAITDKDNLRNLMMNIVRQDFRESLASISLALNSEDSETSHYAASVLQEVLNDFRANVQKRYSQILKEENNQIADILEFIEYMNAVLKQKVLTGIEQRSMTDLLDQVCEVLYQKEKVKMTTHHFEIISLRLLEIENYEKCEKWCERAVQQYPEELATYTCQLKLYFSNGNRDRFFRVLENLCHSNVIIDGDTLEMIRVFL